MTMRVGDQAQGAVPLGGRVNPNLTVLVSSQEPGSIQAETGWQNEKRETEGTASPGTLTDLLGKGRMDQSETEGTVSPWHPDLLGKGRRGQSGL